MANNFFNKILDIIGMGDDSEDILDEEEAENTDEPENSQIEVLPGHKKGKVLSIHSNVNAKIVVAQPEEYEEITTLCDCMKSRKIAIVNLQKLDPKVGQRFVDFASGAAYALDGEIQEVSPGVFLITPNSVEVSSDIKDELSRGLFSWTGK